MTRNRLLVIRVHVEMCGTLCLLNANNGRQLGHSTRWMLISASYQERALLGLRTRLATPITHHVNFGVLNNTTGWRITHIILAFSMVINYSIELVVIVN